MLLLAFRLDLNLEITPLHRYTTIFRIDWETMFGVTVAGCRTRQTSKCVWEEDQKPRQCAAGALALVSARAVGVESAGEGAMVPM